MKKNRGKSRARVAARARGKCKRPFVYWSIGYRDRSAPGGVRPLRAANNTIFPCRREAREFLLKTNLKDIFIVLRVVGFRVAD